MKTTVLLLAAIGLVGCSAAQQRISELRGEVTGTVHNDPEGFRVNVPHGWNVQKLGNGQVAVVSGDRKSYVVVAPVVGELRDCGSLLRHTMSNGWGAFPGAAQVNVAEQGRGSAVARFESHGGRMRGAVLCAAASAKSAMLFGFAAPVDEFASSTGKLVALLRSFTYSAREGSGNGKREAAGPAEPAMESWRDPTEGAFTVSKPAGWRAEGGVRRLSNLDVRTGFRFVSPDNASVIWVGETRLGTCMVPGPQTMQVPGTGGYGGWCPYQTGAQLAESHINQALVGDLGLSGVQITGRRDRTDLTAEADRLPRMVGLQGVRNAFGEVDFTASRGGVGVVGRVAGNTQFMASVDANLLAGSLQRDLSGYVAARGNEALVGEMMSRVLGSLQWNVQWVMANRRAASRDAQATMNYLRGQAELGQKMFEQRMASADRRAEAVGDLLSGTVRLQDAQGNRYQAKAGSNYYYAVEQGLAVESDPNRAVVGTEQWAPLHNGTVDLRPLELVR